MMQFFSQKFLNGVLSMVCCFLGMNLLINVVSAQTVVDQCIGVANDTPCSNSDCTDPSGRICVCYNEQCTQQCETLGSGYACVRDQAECESIVPGGSVGYDKSTYAAICVDPLLCCGGAATTTTSTPDAETGSGSGITVTTPTPTPSVTDLPNPLGTTRTPAGVIRNIIKVFLSILGAIAFLFFVYGGFLFLISAGNQERVRKGRDTLIWATIGLILIFSSYGIAAALFQLFTP